MVENIRALEQKVKYLEALLQEKENLLSFFMSAIDNIPNPIFIKNENAEFVFFNKKYEEVFGIEREIFLGKSVLDLDYLPEHSREKYQEEALHIIANIDETSHDIDFMFSDGRIHPSFYWAKGFVTSQKLQRGLVGEIVDITKAKEQQYDPEFGDT